MKLEGKVAVIPGGTAGIGKEIALAYAREGADVVVMSRKQEHVDKTVAQLKEEGCANPSGYAVDISNEAAVIDVFKAVHDVYGHIDVMLNATGIYPNTAFVETSGEELMAVLTVNVAGPFYCAREAAKYMIPQHEGRIIFLTSGQALKGVALMAHYSASKGALVSLARAMAAELSPLGITVNTIACGLTATDNVTDNMPPALLENEPKSFPVQRIARPEEYNGVAVLLASDEGSYITAETIAVDGGTSNASVPNR